MPTPLVSEFSGELITAGLEIADQPGINFVSRDVATNYQNWHHDEHRRIVTAAELPFPMVEVHFADFESSGLDTDERGLTPVAITLVDEGLRTDSRGIEFVTSTTLQLEVATRSELDTRLDDVPFQFRVDQDGFVGFPPLQSPRVPLRTELRVQRHDKDRRHQPGGYNPRRTHELPTPTRMRREDIHHRDMWAPFFVAYKRRAQAVLQRAIEVAKP